MRRVRLGPQPVLAGGQHIPVEVTRVFSFFFLLLFLNGRVCHPGRRLVAAKREQVRAGSEGTEEKMSDETQNGEANEAKREASERRSADTDTQAPDNHNGVKSIEPRSADAGACTYTDVLTSASTDRDSDVHHGEKHAPKPTRAVAEESSYVDVLFFRF